jgi:hypothetical protein
MAQLVVIVSCRHRIDLLARAPTDREVVFHLSALAERQKLDDTSNSPNFWIVDRQFQ